MVPRGIVEVRFGRMSGHKAVLEPGQTITVGRTDRANLVIPHDPQMSGVHLEIRWDGTRASVRDLGSAKGTLLRGAPVQEAELPHGGWIRAGDTDFMFYVEGNTPPRPSEDENLDTVEKAMAREGALATLREESAHGALYAVLDAARDERVLELVRESVQPYRSLYDGVQGEALAEVAPHLVALGPNAPLIDALVVEGWGKRWGIWLVCRLPLGDVRRHLRRFLMVEDDETGEKLYLRYYDPAVLRVFLPACGPRQKADFFGPIEAFLVEGRHGEVVRMVRGDSDGAELSQDCGVG